jgi:hypothetical protein
MQTGKRFISDRLSGAVKVNVYCFEWKNIWDKIPPNVRKSEDIFIFSHLDRGPGWPGGSREIFMKDFLAPSSVSELRLK